MQAITSATPPTASKSQVYDITAFVEIPVSLGYSLANPSHRRTQKSHVEKLEEKLDGLVTLLKSTHQSTARCERGFPVASNMSSAHSTVDSSSNTVSQLFPGILKQPWTHSEGRNGGNPFQSQISRAPSQRRITPIMTPITVETPDPTFPEIMEFTSDEANGLLDRFRDNMASFLPFLVVPSSVSAEDLNHDRPFLLKAILAIASRIPSQRLAIGKWLVAHLANRMAVNGERNMDLLLGVVAYTGWFVALESFRSDYFTQLLLTLDSLTIGAFIIATMSRNSQFWSA